MKRNNDKDRDHSSVAHLVLATALNVWVNLGIIMLFGSNTTLLLGVSGFWWGYVYARPFGILDAVDKLFRRIHGERE